jgi:hypothetical protein
LAACGNTRYTLLVCIIRAEVKLHNFQGVVSFGGQTYVSLFQGVPNTKISRTVGLGLIMHVILTKKYIITIHDHCSLFCMFLLTE